MDSFVRGFLKKIEKKRVNIAVIGLGYVGLPLAIEFAKKKIEVSGIEIDKGRLEHIKAGESYITDVSSDELRAALKSRKFKAGGDFRILRQADIIIICVPTPLKRKYNPNIVYIKQAVRSIYNNLKKGSLIILESTTYPGTTEEVILPILESGGRKHNTDFFLSFSPERIDPGNPDYPVRKIPKIVGGISKEATMLAVAVYKNIIDEVVPVSSARTAETAKLLENTFRLVNIGLIDELAIMANKMDINIWEVIDAAKTKPFGFMPFYPGPGVGGHCIPKDPLYLYWKAKHFGFRSRFIKLASDIINNMPEYCLSRIEHILRGANIALKESRILVIGVTYKKDIKDLRKSPSIDIIESLHKRNIEVSYYDPLIPYLKLNRINLKSVELRKDVLNNFDCVIIATDHSCIDYDLVLKHANLIFDTRNIYKTKKNRKVFTL